MCGIAYSFFAVKSENADEYQSGGSYSIDNIKGKKMSFVSNRSTSGFKVPTNTIISHFADDNLIVDDLLEGGSDAFFSEVLFDGSHQGSAFNLLSGKSDVSAFCDIKLAPYATCTDGTPHEAGSVYTINADASAPFDTVQGQTYTVIQSTPVLNGPFAYNGDTLSPEDVKAIQKLFTSSLDNKSKVLVKDKLLKLKQEDTSMIGIFHDLEFMDGLCGIALNKKSLQYLGVKYCKDFLLFLFCRSSAALHAFQDKVMYLFRTNVQNNAEFLIHAVFRRMHGCHICGG